MLSTIAYDGGILGLSPLIFIPFFWRDPAVRLFTWCAGLPLTAVVIETYMLLHYLAPLIVVGTLISALVLDRLWKFRRTRCADRILLACVLSASLIAGPIWRAAHALGGARGQLYRGDGFGSQRAQVVHTILSHPGNHVVFVHFTPEQNPLHTWVANGANIDSAPVVWAHDRGPENVNLEEYFRGRTFWFLEDKPGKVTLLPYHSPGSSLR